MIYVYNVHFMRLFVCSFRDYIHSQAPSIVGPHHLSKHTSLVTIEV